MKAFADKTKQEIVDNFNNRWGVDGYRDSIEKLAEAMSTAKASGNYDAAFEMSDQIAATFDQGVNTVTADAHRIALAVGILR